MSAFPAHGSNDFMPPGTGGLVTRLRALGHECAEGYPPGHRLSPRDALERWRASVRASGGAPVEAEAINRAASQARPVWPAKESPWKN